MKLNELTITEAAEGIRKKNFTVTELVLDCLRAIKEKNSELHAYLEVFDDALDEAKKADEILGAANHEERIKLPPLFGIPLAIKDNILIEGKRCTAGSKILENYVANYNATVIRKLKKQGAIFLGKANLDEFAMGSSTENSAYVSTKNPNDISRIPGGSSGGSAAAVAANLCVAALGSDTGGSIRQPASFCGIVGLKPTYGAVSRHGLIAMASSLDQIGPLAKSVEDAAILFDAIKGKDDFDSTAVKDNYKLPTINYKLNGVRVGIPKEYFGKGLESEVKRVIENAVGKMEQAGAIIKEISLPHSEYALPTYYIVVPSEVSANLARFDGIRYGVSAVTSHQLSISNLYDVYAKSRAFGFGAEVKRRIMLGTYTLSAGYYDAYYVKAQKVRRLIRQDFEHALDAVDIIAGPTTPTPAFHLGERADDPLQMYLADIYTVAVNLAGVPAISIPAGCVEREGKKLPVGLQFIGKWFEEEKLLGIAKETEKIIKLH
ncbi:MAG: Glutamyl-tRNA(Gln) amidotransferase subunit A [Parcubacteria group bacterium GW2011_GWA2_45_30]|nr:MAG: Glutamyl-tRNA(Gln) amidotransferase subunit A [Parcubacteria group bacterium GW2011_GWA2_45_30]